MSFTVAEFHDLVRLVEERPEWRAELRRLVLTEELLALPEQIARFQNETQRALQQLANQVAGLTVAQASTDEQIKALGQAQARTEDEIKALGQAQARTEASLNALSLAQASTDEQIKALGQAQARTEDEIKALGQAQARTEASLNALSLAQASTDEQIKALGHAQARTEEILTALSLAQASTDEQIKALGQAQARTEEELRWLVNWQRGESGRRDGERYENDTLRRAPVLFHGGQGGPPYRPDIQQRLTTALESLLSTEDIESENDPFLADLLWWKGEQLAIVEVSLQVDRQDVSRAQQRAKTLTRGGAPAIAVVIGEQWATPEARSQAQTRQVEWKVDGDLSDGFLSFRRQESKNSH
jgi:DNA repair exonuclease SbcCD ATPase subunit